MARNAILMNEHLGWARIVSELDEGTRHASRNDAMANARRLRDERECTTTIRPDPQGRGHVVEVYKHNGWLVGALKMEG